MFGLTVDRESAVSIARQLTGQLRTMILKGALAAGTRLPPTRSLASELSIARNTVLQVYEQLTAEGYLSGRTGSGTYVAALNQQGDALPAVMPIGDAAWIKDGAQTDDTISFEAGLIDYRHFPRAAWTRVLREASTLLPQHEFAYGDTIGLAELRTELSQYLYRTKDITCSPEQIVILPGATSGVDIACWAFKGNTTVVMEDPCVDFMRKVLIRNGYAVEPVGVDNHGMRTELLKDIDTFGLLYVVPSHQFPTGNVLPIRRRLELLHHARRCGAYIIEDDYDSEFRYEGEPIQTLRHLDPERVIYLGSFSKIFSPTLRMGYMILPWEAMNKMRSAMEAINLSVPIILQHALAEFLRSGQLERHIYKMKRIYMKKRRLFMHELRNAFGENIIISGENAGMHLMVTFTDHTLCRGDFERMRAFRAEAEWSEDYALVKDAHEAGMILGYGALTEEEIVVGVSRLKAALWKDH